MLRKLIAVLALFVIQSSVLAPLALAVVSYRHRRAHLRARGPR